MQSNSLIPALTIRNSFIATYCIWDGDRRRIPPQPKSNQAQAHLSAKARQRLTIAIELLTSAAQTKRLWWSEEKRYVSFKLSFVTLTLPSKQVHPDNVIREKLLKPFLRWWRDKNPSLLYIWKAEVQDNGNIHFHLTTNAFIHWRHLRRKWNQCVNALGYVDRCKVSDPNSTDVHSVKNIRNLAAYLCSYMSKKDLYTKVLKRYHRRYCKQHKKTKSDRIDLPKNYFKHIKRQVDCKLWDASKLLLEGPCRIVMPNVGICRDLDNLQATGCEIVDLEHCRIYNTRKGGRDLTTYINNEYNKHIATIRERCKTSIALID